MTSEAACTHAPRAIGYVRVSTQEQADEGISIAAQCEAIEAYCAMRRLELIDLIVDEGVSGGKPLCSRPGGQQLHDADVDAIIAYKLDRLFRDAADCLVQTRKWDSEGIALHLIDLGGQSLDTSSAMGRFFLTVMAGAAELERNQIRERTKAAMAAKKAKRQLVGSVPYGYELADDGVHLEPDPEEQELLREAQRLRADGKSLRAIARELSRQGFTNRAGRPLRHPTIRNILEAS